MAGRVAAQPKAYGRGQKPIPLPGLVTARAINRWLSSLAALALPGVIIEYAGTTVPPGWLACDGSAVSRTTYLALFTQIGTTWGAGDGATTFNVPDLRNLFLRGSGAEAVGITGGATTETLTAAEMPLQTVTVHDPGHNHGVNDPQHTHTVNDPQHLHPGGAQAGVAGAGAGADATPSSTGLASTGITNANASTGISIANNTTGVTATVGNVSPAPVPIIPPYAVVRRLIKT